MLQSGATMTVGEVFFGTVGLRGGRTLATAVGGTINWVEGDIYGGEGARIENAGSFFIQPDRFMRGENLGGTRMLVHNTGTIAKQAGAGTTALAAVDNDGLITGTSGVLSLQGGDAGNEETGDFGATGPDASVVLETGTFKLVDGARITGQAALANASVEVAGTVPVTSAGSFKQSGGFLYGHRTLNVLGGVTWTGGYQQDAGSTVLNRAGR